MSSSHTCSLLVFGLVLIAQSVILTDLKAHQESLEPPKSVAAVRIRQKPPTIDGLLDDDIWEEAPIYSGFLQREPEQGNPGTEKTSFQIAYDDEAVYFGVLCYDSEPEKISARLGRRDSRLDSDRVSINLDPYHDHQTGYWFSVYASGVQYDGSLAGRRGSDETWDGIWEAKTVIHDRGWNAEFKIPYHVLRFTQKRQYVWGINVLRDISRKNERDLWVLITREQSGWVSYFGHLEGIQNISPPRHLEITPYLMGRSIHENQTSLFSSIGGNVRYGITSGTSVIATINPDFGQVEADPAELNLSAFESYYEERRPFFVEGASVFQMGDYELFYSRRIGNRPGRFEIPGGGQEIDRPEATTILSAVKLTGKTKNQTTFGVLNAVAAPEYARIQEEDGATETDRLIEPLTNYFVGRISQDVLAGDSRIGLLTTAVNRQDSESAFVGALDWNLKFRDNKYNLSGTLSTSRTGESGVAKEGYLAHLEFDKRRGWLGWEVRTVAKSPGYDVNDLGFDDIRELGVIECSFDSYIRRDNPIGPFQKGYVSIERWVEWNYDRIRVSNGAAFWAWGELKNNWDFRLSVDRDFDSVNDERDVLMYRPSAWSIGCYLDTDDRKAVSFGFSPRFSKRDNGLSYSRRLRFSMEFRPSSNIECRLGPSYSQRSSYAQWIGTIRDDKGNHYVYGELDSKTLDFTTRLSMSFTPNLSFQLYMQPFIAIGDYQNFKELVEPQTYDFKAYKLDANRDFYRRSLRGNMVLRWEFQPGSTIFVVWSQSREAEQRESLTSEDLRLRPLDRFLSTFTDKATNLFLVKVNYWFGV